MNRECPICQGRIDTSSSVLYLSEDEKTELCGALCLQHFTIRQTVNPQLIDPVTGRVTL